MDGVGTAGMTGTRKRGVVAGLADATRSLGRAVGTAIGPSAERRSRRLGSYLQAGLTVFVFHEVTDQPSEFQRRASIYTRPALLESQIRWIGQRFEVIAPARLPQLGPEGPMPSNAALITFDDAWAGVFRIGLPILASLRVPALCFINSGTVEGAPDLGAVRLFERLHPPPGGRLLDRPHDLSTGQSALAAIAERYGADAQFAAFQGSAATAEDLAGAAASGTVCFGLHLRHHWDLALIDDELLEASLDQNRRALDPYGNLLPAFAPPYGRSTAPLLPVARRAGMRAVFVADGGQNHHADTLLLDRITLPTDRDTPADWWYETHRRRLFGPLARR